MTSVPCEVGFSRPHHLKSSRRTRLRTFVLSCLLRISLVKVTVAEFKATLCARAVKHFTNMVKRKGLVTTNAELTEYVRECAKEDAVANTIPFDEPCQVQDEDIQDI